MNNHHCLAHSILFLKHPQNKSANAHMSREVLWCHLVPATSQSRKRTGLNHPQLEHVEDGIVHLGKYSQVDWQAGLTILSCWSACEPGKCIVLFQNKPEHIRGGL